jgi:hypothetical protein
MFTIDNDKVGHLSTKETIFQSWSEVDPTNKLFIHFHEDKYRENSEILTEFKANDY